jgi:hypothetical protein
MGGKPHEFVLEGYNSDAIDEHRVMVRITILEEPKLSLVMPPVAVYQGIV